MAIAPEIIESLQKQQLLSHNNRLKKENPFTLKKIEELDSLRLAVRVKDGKAIAEEPLTRGSSGRETDSEVTMARLENANRVVNYSYRNNRAYREFSDAEFEQFKGLMLKPEDGPPPFIISGFGNANWNWEKLPFIFRPFKPAGLQSNKQYFVLSYFYYSYYYQCTINIQAVEVGNPKLKRDLEHGHILFSVESLGFQVCSQVVDFTDIGPDKPDQPKIIYYPCKNGFYQTLDELIKIELSQALLEERVKVKKSCDALFQGLMPSVQKNAGELSKENGKGNAIASSGNGSDFNMDLKDGQEGLERKGTLEKPFLSGMETSPDNQVQPHYSKHVVSFYTLIERNLILRQYAEANKHPEQDWARQYQIAFDAVYAEMSQQAFNRENAEAAQVHGVQMDSMQTQALTAKPQVQAGVMKPQDHMRVAKPQATVTKPQTIVVKPQAVVPVPQIPPAVIFQGPNPTQGPRQILVRQAPAGSTRAVTSQTAGAARAGARVVPAPAAVPAAPASQQGNVNKPQNSGSGGGVSVRTTRTNIGDNRNLSNRP